ncbi:MAG: STAS domain-containing protein [Lachnospiraceae bacterium]|nr:STAS domain-containing protein [Lachnospiraceae bacterium]
MQKNTVIYVSGEVDSANVEEFEQGLITETEGEKKVVIDLTDFEYISSTGLRVLLMLQKKYGQGDALSIRNVNDEVMDIFNVTGFSKLLHID